MDQQPIGSRSDGLGRATDVGSTSNLASVHSTRGSRSACRRDVMLKTRLKRRAVAFLAFELDSRKNQLNYW